jgi:hypothetical protein
MPRLRPRRRRGSDRRQRAAPVPGGGAPLTSVKEPRAATRSSRPPTRSADQRATPPTSPTRTHATLDLVSPTPGRILFGPAATISYFPTCAASLDPDRYNLGNLFYEAVGDEPAGKVLVLSANGYTDTSMAAARSSFGFRSTDAPVC